MNHKKVGIVGSGLIGRSWAMLFAAAEYNVYLYDIKQSQLDDALEFVRIQLETLMKDGMLRGKLPAASQYDLIKTTCSLEEAVQDSFYVQECVPEVLSLKQKVLLQISEACTNDSTIIGSSVSCLLPSKIFDGIAPVSRCIVAHPTNPPYYCPLTEIVPHPETHPEVVAKTKALMEELGQCPVMVKKEVDGFCSNPMQYAIINEAWRLVEDGIMSPQDVDKVFTHGLGMRYAFIGPFETIHLNAEGTRNYMERYRQSIRRVSNTFGPIPTFDGETLDNINKEIHQDICASSQSLEGRRRWRDDRLAGLARLKKEMNEKTEA